MQTATPTGADIIEGTVTAHAHLQIPTKALIDWVNQAFETEAIMYWIEDCKGSKRAELTIGDLTHNYCYQFQVTEAETDNWRDINVETILKGIEAVLSGKDVKLSQHYKNAIFAGVIEAVTEGIGTFDSEALDQVIQIGLFGEAIYG